MYPKANWFIRFVVLVTGIGYRCFFLVLAVFAFANPIVAQDGSGKRHLHLSKTEVSGDNGQLLGIDAQIINNAANMFKARLTIIPDETLELVTRQDDSVVVRPGHSYFHSAKIRIPLKTRSQEGLRVLFELKDEDGSVIEQQYVSVTVNESRNVDFYILEHTMQIRHLKDSVMLPVRLHNTGNTDETIRLILKVPVMPEEKRYRSREFFIPAFTDTVLELTRETTRLGYSLGNFNATVTATYADGDIVGIGTLDIQNLRDRKRFHDTGRYSHLQRFDDDYSLDINGQYLFTEFESYQAAGGSELYWNKARIKYNIDAQVWKDRNIPAYVRNTYADIRGRNSGMIFGNITRNFDIILAGRGVASYLYTHNSRAKWEMGIIDENNNLVGENNPLFPTGTAAWLSNTVQKQGTQADNLLMYEYNTILAEKDLLAGTTLSWNASKQIRLEMALSGSYSRSTVSDSSRFGGSGTITVQGRWERFGFTSENQVSSAHFPGIKRGVSYFSQRVLWNSEKFVYGLAFSYYQSKPEYITSGNSFSNHIRNSKVELSFGGQLFTNMSFSVMPGYYHEQNYYTKSSVFTPKSEIWSYGSGIQLNHSNLQRKKFLFVYAEIGAYHAPLVTGKSYPFHAKISASARSGWFSLSLYKQVGEFYASDVGNRFYQRADYTDILNISPVLHHAFFKKKLEVELGVTYTASNLSANGAQVYGRAEYTLPNENKLYASLRNYQYESDMVQMNDLRIGYRKMLPVGRINTGRKKLMVFVYKDLNNNNSYDPGSDSVANQAVVSINKELLISGDDGVVVYKNLPPAAYSVIVPSARGWYGTERIVDVSRTTRIDMALHRNSVLAGGIEYRERQVTSFDVAEQKDQLRVRATAVDGTVYTTKTDENGHFLFFIPPGKYDVSILSGEYSDKIECHNCLQPVVLRDGATANVVFQFSVRGQQVKLQKFVSPNIKKQ